MSIKFFFRRGTAAEHTTFTGDLNEITLDTTNNALKIHDGVTAGGASLSGGVTDHGALTGLADDDHTQYHTDARGDARYRTLAAGVPYGDLTGVPSTFTPTTHAHIIGDVTGLQTALDAKLAAASYTAADVLAKLLTVDGATSGLDADLLDGQSGAFYLAWGNLTSVPSTFAPSAHTHAAADVTSGVFGTARLGTGTQDTSTFLRGDGTWIAPPGGGGATWGAITGTLSSQTDLQSALDGKSATGHTHVAANITDLATTLSAYLTTAAATSGYQPLDGDLTAIAALAGTSGLARKTAANTWTLDTAAYLTGNQTVTLSGDVTGSGATAITTSLSAATVTGKALTGYAAGANTALAAADTVLAAFGKVQGQINARLTANQTITLSGDATGSGATAITVAIASFAGSAKGLVPVSVGGTTNFLRADGSWAAPPAGGSVAWGAITGTLSAQTDLQSALDAKLASSSYTAADVLAKLLTVDGTTSGLDADLLDGQNGSYYLDLANASGTLGVARLPALTGGDVTSSAGSSTLTIGTNAVTLAKMAQVATGTLLGRTTAATGNVEALSLALFARYADTTANFTGTLQSGGIEVGYRAIPRSTTTTTAVVADRGKCIAATAGITVPNSTFAAGDSFSIYNNSASAITITAGVTTLRLAGTATTGNRTLAGYGMATVWFNSATEAVIGGSGLT